MNSISIKDLISSPEFSENLKKWYINKYKFMHPKEEEYPFDNKIKDEESEPSNEDDTETSPPQDIVVFNELRSCGDLIRMAAKGMDYSPEFQRNFVWTEKAQARFIDSLVKGLPIPSICISYDYERNVRYVIDGRQRIETIIEFINNKEYRLPQMADIDEKIAGKTSKELEEGTDVENKIYERIINFTIPVTVIRCNYSKENHMQYLFKIFHRLNSGGTKLNNQEIRNCIYGGLFNRFLKDMGEYKNFKLLMNIKPEKEYRFLWQEMCLRFFAFNDRLEVYTGRLASFLNDYMFTKHEKEIFEDKLIKKGADKEEIDNTGLIKELEDKAKLFTDTVDLMYGKIFGSKPMEHKSKALLDALFVGIFKNIETLAVLPDKTILEYYNKLINHKDFSTDKLKEGVAQKQKLQGRINKAIEIFSGK